MKTIPASNPQHLSIGAACALALACIIAVTPSLRAEATAAADAHASDAVLEKCLKLLNYGEPVSLTGPTKVDGVVALGILGDGRAVRPLIEHLVNEQNSHLRMQIAKALGWLGSKEAVPALEAALRDNYPYLRKQAAIALKQITGKDYEFDRTGLPDTNKLRSLIEASAAGSGAIPSKKD